MRFFTRDKTKQAGARLAEESLYAAALREIQSGLRRDGIWARALSECSMDQAQAAARYIELRVQAMKDEEVLQHALAAQQELEAMQEQVEREEADLPRHPSCGGVIDRSEVGRRINWKCRKCRAVGSFLLGSPA